MRLVAGMVLVGCATEPGNEGEPGGDGYAEGGQDCVVEREELVSDPAVVPAGFSLSWDDVGTPLVGAFSGTSVELGLAIQADVAVDQVWARTWRVVDDSGSSAGTPIDCPPARYEATGTLLLSAQEGDVLDEYAAIELVFDGETGAGSTFAEWAVDDMTGSLRPTENDVDEWSANSLHAVLDASPDGWLLDLYFYGNDAEPGATGPIDHYEEHVTTDTLLAPFALPAD